MGLYEYMLPPSLTKVLWMNSFSIPVESKEIVEYWNSRFGGGFAPAKFPLKSN